MARPRGKTDSRKKGRLRLIVSSGVETFRIGLGWRIAAWAAAGAVWGLFLMSAVNPFAADGEALAKLTELWSASPYWISFNGLIAVSFVLFIMKRIIEAASAKIEISETAFVYRRFLRRPVVIPWASVKFIAPMRSGSGGLLHGFTVISDDNCVNVYSAYFPEKELFDAINRRLDREQSLFDLLLRDAWRG